MNRMKIQKASEDYLEAMLRCKEQHGYIRSIDIAEMVGVTKARVSYATKRLRENGYITMDDSGFIELTEKGLEIAQSILERHNIITRFLESLGVSHETALLDACKMEHDLSDETMECIKQTLLNKQ